MLVNYYLGLLLLAVSHLAQGSHITENSEIILAFLVHRHGDRTPLTANFSFSNNPDALRKIVDKYGYGELTPRGKSRGYQIGQFIRNRYPFLGPRYNESEIYLRSTDITRTKMTMLTSMAAVYPAGADNWSKDVNWTPVPYTTLPITVDFMKAICSCPKYTKFYNNANKQSLGYKWQNILSAWSKIVGRNISDPIDIYTTYDEYYCQQSLGIPLNKDLEALQPEIEKAAYAATQYLFGNEENVPLLSGKIFNEFFDAASDLIKGLRSPKVRVYSAHDVNIYTMTAASKIKEDFRPGMANYGSIFGLEVRKLKTGRYIVVPIYVKDPATRELNYLPIEGCDYPCDIRSFMKITKKNTLNQNAWEERCKVKYIDSHNCLFI